MEEPSEPDMTKPIEKIETVKVQWSEFTDVWRRKIDEVFPMKGMYLDPPFSKEMRPSYYTMTKGVNIPPHGNESSHPEIETVSISPPAVVLECLGSEITLDCPTEAVVREKVPEKEIEKHGMSQILKVMRKSYWKRLRKEFEESDEKHKLHRHMQEEPYSMVEFEFFDESDMTDIDVQNAGEKKHQMASRDLRASKGRKERL